MKKIYFNKKIMRCLSCLLMLVLTFAVPDIANAEEKETQIVTLDTQKDLAVMFIYDSEVVDITFVSPSGKEYTSSDSDVEMEEGDLWRTYRIKDASAGEWSVRYDLGKNSEIQYSIIDDEFGLWIQYFTISSIMNDTASVKFEADNDSDISYEYEIYSVDTTDTSSVKKLADGNADANTEVSEDVSLKELSSGNYMFRLNVYYQNGDAEVYDSAVTDAVDYVNPNEPEKIENYCVYVDLTNSECTVDWSDYKNSSDGYRLIINCDDEIVYDEELDGDISYDNVFYPTNAEKLSVSLYYKSNGIWSSPLTKDIDLTNGEYLKLDTQEVTGSGQFTLSYMVNEARVLYVTLDEDKDNNENTPSEYPLTGDGFIALDLEVGSNSIYAEFESDDKIFYVVNSTVYYDPYPPEITLYEDLDGKTFTTDTVDIMGCVTGANELLINDVKVELDDSGEFCHTISLENKENIVTIEAVDILGNSAMNKMTIYKGIDTKDSISGKPWYIRYLPLFSSILTSLLIIVLAFIFMRRENVKRVGKNSTVERKRNGIIKCIIADVLLVFIEAGCVYEFIIHYTYSNSLEFLEMAEKSVNDAAEFLTIRDGFAIASIVGLVLLIISITWTVLVVRKHRNK